MDAYTMKLLVRELYAEYSQERRRLGQDDDIFSPIFEAYVRERYPEIEAHARRFGRTAPYNTYAQWVRGPAPRR